MSYTPEAERPTAGRLWLLPVAVVVTIACMVGLGLVWLAVAVEALG